MNNKSQLIKIVSIKYLKTEAHQSCEIIIIEFKNMEADHTS